MGTNAGTPDRRLVKDRLVAALVRGAGTPEQRTNALAWLTGDSTEDITASVRRATATRPQQPEPRTAPPDEILDSLRSDLGALEADVIRVLWRLGGTGTIRDIRDRLDEDGTARAYNTVMQTAADLAERGILTRSREGRAHIYRSGPPADTAVKVLANRFRTLLGPNPPEWALQGALDGFEQAGVSRQRVVEALRMLDAGVEPERLLLAAG